MTLWDYLWIGLAIYAFAINLTGYALMGINKNRARRSAWRIPEATLFGVALIGGSLGTTLGMKRFRHKTKHWYFRYGMPAILFIQIALSVLLATHFL
jgi:uncharacterized membrane protein YsdA (DUF1294 family)